ncbi:MAG: hypothetical protein KFF77_09625 [Bacteroidetes bacterium]|nr:hypothetical protein [Bacteroidota bacterium]
MFFAVPATLCLMLLLLFSSHVEAMAGGEVRGRGPRSAAMGGAGVALHGVEAVLGNPAMLVGSRTGAMLCWTPARFGMTELADAAAGGSVSFDRWTAAVDVRRFGYEKYAEHRAGIAVAVAPAQRVSVGARMGVLHFGIEGYGSTSVFQLDLGAAIRFGEEFRLAAAAYAVNMPSFAEDERLPLRLAFGLAWEHDGLLLLLAMEKETRWDADLRAGVEYIVLGPLRLRCGYANLSRQWSAGFGLRQGAFELGYAMMLHSELGATHTVGLAMNL